MPDYVRGKLSLPICIHRVHLFFFFFFIYFLFFWPCGQKRLNYLTRMRRGSNNRETPKGVPSSKNNRQLVTCRPFRDSCMRTKPNSYSHGSYRLGSVYRQGSKTLFHAYGPRRFLRVSMTARTQWQGKLPTFLLTADRDYVCVISPLQ